EEKTMTLFHGEDFHIPLPSLEVEVTYRNRSAPRLGDVVLMKGGVGLSSRAHINRYGSHLVIDAVMEGDEGTYTIKNPNNPADVRSLVLVVRDCTNEQTIKYGGNFRILLSGVNSPITLEYRPIAVEANQTFRPALVLLTSTGMSREGYRGRISVSPSHVTLTGVTGADKGSYTVRDVDGQIKIKLCLNVREHRSFVSVPSGERLKIDLVLNSSLVQLYYSPNSDPTPRLLLDKGAFTSAQAELGFEGRLSVEGSMVVLDQVRAADVGEFKITDILGFTVSRVDLELQPYKLETLYVTIIALLGLLVFLLLVCLLSCLIKVKKRAKRAAALEKIAQNAGKENEGEAFRQVVKNITKLSEHSQAENTEKSQSTEVDIKGLEVSSKEVGVNNLETSDSGVGFNTALPLDTDTEAPDPISESTAVTISAAPETKPSPAPAAGSAPAETKPTPEKTHDRAPTPESAPAPKAPSAPEPITNGTPEPGLDAKPSPDHPDPTGSPALKSAPPKTPE
uniref:Si:dkeyp-77h1.4 n=1 Tax=Tetraodon nigroviridis TaxID=99883 RepID=H3CRF1_TETNG